MTFGSVEEDEGKTLFVGLIGRGLKNCIQELATDTDLLKRLKLPLCRVALK